MVRRASRILVAATLLAAATLLVTGKAVEDPPKAAAPTRGEAPDSRKPPVVWLILDEFPVDSLLEPDGRIDAARYPNFARLARRSTWFPNSHTIYDSTFKAVPAMMDARLPRRGREPDLPNHPRNIYTLFGALGYRMVDSEPGTALCPPRYCPHARKEHPPVIPRLVGGGRPARLRKWIYSMHPSSRPTLYVQHAFFPHEPWIYLPSGKQMRPTGEDPVGGLNHAQGFHDRDLTHHNEERYLLQLGFLDRELGRLLRQLRHTQLFDRALIVVTADHGYAFQVGVKDRRKVTQSNVHQIAPTPLFIKAPRQRRGRVDLTYVRTVDVLPTVADILGIRIGWRHEGHSAFSLAARQRRSVQLVTRDFSRVVKIGVGDLEQRRRANIDRRARLFGTGAESLRLYGSPWAQLYRIGPHRRLLGRRLAGLAVRRAAAPARARLANAPLTRNVDAFSKLMPIQVEGRLEPGRPRARRDLAVAVNGVVRAVGRSFHLEGKPGEYFSILVPEDSMSLGPNDVRVFKVSRRRRSLSLAPLGRN